MLILRNVSFQNEKGHMLLQSETEKMKDRDEKHNAELQQWRESLVPRKKASIFYEAFQIYDVTSFFIKVAEILFFICLHLGGFCIANQFLVKNI